ALPIFLLVHGNAAKAVLYDKGTEVLVVINLGEYNKHVGKAPVRNPHLLAVDDVVLSVGIQYGARLGAVCVRTGVGFRQTVCRFPFTRGKLGNVSLLLFIIAVVKNRKCTDACVRRQGNSHRVSSTDRKSTRLNS